MADNIHSDYAHAGFNGSLPFGEKAALVIIDVVMAYIDPESPLYLGPDDKLPALKRLSNAAREACVPVIFTNIAYGPEGIEGGMFFRKVPALKAFHAGSPLGAFPDSMLPQDGDTVIGKYYPSAFFGTALAPMLHTMDIDTLLLTGYSTSGCVRASALDALCHGFAPFVVSDCCADRASGPHDANLFDMQAKMAEVIDCDNAVELMRNMSENSRSA